MEWFNQLRFSLFRLNNFCDRCTNPVSRNLFWDWRDSETFAEEEDAEDLFEDSLSEVLEEISPHVEEKKEDKSAGVEEERENMPDDKVEEKADKGDAEAGKGDVAHDWRKLCLGNIDCSYIVIRSFTEDNVVD